MREHGSRQARRWLVWCLVALLPCLSLGIAQRQTLGPLHVHAPVAVAAADSPGLHGTAPWAAALDWWWAQVQAQTQARQHARAHAEGQAHGHGEVVAAASGHADGSAQAQAQAQTHVHDGWQRHHHDPQDTSVMALDAHAEVLEVQGAAASLMLPVLGAPADGLRIEVAVARPEGWPRTGAARFSSRGTAPPLQPPRG